MMKLDEAARDLLLALDMWSCWRPERVSKQIGILRSALDAPKVAPPAPSEVCPNGCLTGAGTCVLDWEPTYDSYGARDDEAWRCWICNCGWNPGEELKPKERAK